MANFARCCYFDDHYCRCRTASKRPIPVHVVGHAFYPDDILDVLTLDIENVSEIFECGRSI